MIKIIFLICLAIVIILSINKGAKLVANDLYKINRINYEELMKYSSIKYIFNKIKHVIQN